MGQAKVDAGTEKCREFCFGASSVTSCVSPSAAGRLLRPVRGHVVRRRLLSSAQRGSEIRGGLQREQEEVTAVGHVLLCLEQCLIYL